VTARKLAGIGIETCGALAVADPDVLGPVVGRWADGLRQLAVGIDGRPVVAHSGPPKSVSSETTFAVDIIDGAALESILVELAAGVGAALRKRGLAARTVTVKFRLANFTTFTRQCSVEWPIESDADIARAAVDIFRRHWPKRPLRLLGVGVAKLQPPAGRQLSLGW
jgi:nucleotidyltransferase/DNA polymerase involved in DNA repair